MDVIYPAWPALLYLNPALGKYLLTGLFQYQATGQYPNKYSVHDLGASYPKALGHNDGKDEAMPVEECGNMLIMTLSHAQKTGDHSLLTTYVSEYVAHIERISRCLYGQRGTCFRSGHNS